MNAPGLDVQLTTPGPGPGTKGFAVPTDAVVVDDLDATLLVAKLLLVVVVGMGPTGGVVVGVGTAVVRLLVVVATWLVVDPVIVTTEVNTEVTTEVGLEPGPVTVEMTVTVVVQWWPRPKNRRLRRLSSLSSQLKGQNRSSRGPLVGALVALKEAVAISSF